MGTRMRSFPRTVHSLFKNNLSMLRMVLNCISSEALKGASVSCPSPHQLQIACSHRSSHVCHLRVRTLCHHIPRAWKMRYDTSRRSCMIPASARATPAHPWRSPACRQQSCDGECRFMRGPLLDIDVPSHRLTTTDDRSENTQNGYRKSGSRWTEMGFPTQHNLRKLRRASTSQVSTSAWKCCPKNSRASSP